MNYRIFKFKDTVDGRYAFVLAPTLAIAEKAIQDKTTIPVECVDAQDVDNFPDGLVLVNKILPF